MAVTRRGDMDQHKVKVDLGECGFAVVSPLSEAVVTSLIEEAASNFVGKIDRHVLTDLGRLESDPAMLTATMQALALDSPTLIVKFVTASVDGATEDDVRRLPLGVQLRLLEAVVAVTFSECSLCETAAAVIADLVTGQAATGGSRH